MGARISKAKPGEPTRREPLRGVYHRMKNWLQRQYDNGQEPRTTTLRTRVELELSSEIGIQRALQRMRPRKFQEFVLDAAKYRLQQIQLNRGSKNVQEWIKRTLMPQCGGRHRSGQKFNLAPDPPSELKCRLQWAQSDYMTWLVLKGNSELLAPLVQNPELFIANRHQTLFAQTDATAVWLKLRGEEARVVPVDVLDKLARVRRDKARWKRVSPGLDAEESQLLQEALQASLQEAENLKYQVDQQWSQGGDKHRLTLLVTGVVTGWFSSDKTPEGYMEPIKLLYRCAHPVRLEDITDQGTWARDHEYIDSCGQRLTRKKGGSAKGLLTWWVQFRARYPDHDFWKYYRVWGQPSAWQDQVITTWLVQDLAASFQEKFGTTQCIHQWDCLSAQWCEPVLHESWVQNQVVLPVMPDATAYLQSPDTHWNFQYKADIKASKAELQQEQEIACQRVGKPVSTNWGLFELAEARRVHPEKKGRGERQREGCASIPKLS